VAAVDEVVVVDDAFAPSRRAAAECVVEGERFRRERRVQRGAECLVDTFPDEDGAACCFLRLECGTERNVRLAARGVDRVRSCASGGWILSASASPSLAYWVPQPPVLRTLDSNGRILSQQNAAPAGFEASANDLLFDVVVPAGVHLDVTVWRLGAQAIRDALEQPFTIERQGVFLRSSHGTYRGAADLYRCLVHGHVYDDRFVWRQIWGGFRWRICSENEAYALYHAMNGLELATGRPFYGLLRRQILYSVISRQAADGGWHHGEWTDLMESHFRLHNAGIELLEAALEQQPDPTVRASLDKAVSFVTARTDATDAGVWFLHDALEESVETATAKDAPPWTPTRVLGASASNKLILNTHLDAIVAMTRYARITGNVRYEAQLDSARSAARTVLALRPAERLYRILYGAVRLTLLPAAKAKTLPLPTRAVRRLARTHLNPRLYRVKRAFPRFVMPGGLIDRHLSPKHFDMGYHTVNLMDVARLHRCHPEDGYRPIIDEAVRAVSRNGLLETWVESRHKQALGYWMEALYALCTLDDSATYRRLLAEAILCAEDIGIGLPPSLLGADVEAVAIGSQLPCPSPADPRLRVANLSRNGRQELLVVNTGSAPLALTWQTGLARILRWTGADGVPLADSESAPAIAARSWLLGVQRATPTAAAPTPSAQRVPQSSKLPG